MVKSMIICTGMAIGVVGCARPTEPPTPALAPGEVSLLKPRPAAVVENPSTLLAGGTLPLAVVFENGGSIRVVGAGGKELLATTVPPRTTIAVSEGGVIVGGKRVVSGPLSASQRHEIWWDAKGPRTPAAPRTAAPVPGSRTMLASGMLPLTAVVEDGGGVQIVGITTARPVTATVPPRTRIHVTEEGVRVGETWLVRGALPPNRYYEIWGEAKKSEGK